MLNNHVKSCSTQDYVRKRSRIVDPVGALDSAILRSPGNRWFKSHVFLELLVWSAISLLSTPYTLNAQITVGSSAYVSQPMEHAAHTEVFIAANPADSEQLGVCSMMIDSGQNRLSSALYLSRDAGVTWNLAVHDTTGPRGEAWDPTCAFGPGGTVLFATLPSQGDPLKPDFKRMTRVHRSTNRGETWEVPTETVYLDNEDLVVDWTEGPYRGRTYLVGVRQSKSVPGRRHLSLAYSANGGQTFQGPVDRFPEPGTLQGHVGAPVVASDGDLLVPVTIRRDWDPESASDTAGVPEQTVAVVRVSNGGTQISAPVNVAAYESCGEAGPPVVAVDNSNGPFDGRVYVAYPDASQGRCQIKLSWSDDGEHWSTPLPVDDPPIPLEPDTGPDAFLPGLAVNNRGVVGIVWYDRREDPRNRDFRLRFTASADGGHSVMNSVPVSQHVYRYPPKSEPEALFPLGIRFDPDSTGASWMVMHTGRSSRIYYQMGDYTGFTARDDGTFQAIWIDNRTKVPQLFTAGVNVATEARTPVSRNKELGHIVSDSVLAAVSSVSFAPESCTVRVGVELLNRASRSFALPLTVRVDEAISQLGVPVSVGSKEDDLGRPLWQVGSQGNKLNPKERITHTAEFKLKHCRSLAGRGAYTYRHTVDARMEGKPPAWVAGPKILAVKLRVFETVSTNKR